MATTLIQSSTHDNIIINDNQVLALLENNSSLDEQQRGNHYDNDENKSDINKQEIGDDIITEETEPNEEQQRLEIMNYLKPSPMSSYTSKKVPRLGPFLLLKTLGVGEFGKVKLGKHIETGQIVAVKLVKKENIDSSSQLEKIRMEIDILKTLNHPYIVKLLSVNETNTNIGMVLEFAQGGELFEYIYRQRHLKEQEACRLFSQLISSVYYMHQKNIVHRDLKLENILLDRHGNLIVTDFGFANQFTPKTGDLMSTSCGSPVYAAPELVMTGRLYAGTGVDIWSCGIILYAMLCGYLPFDDDVKNPNGDNIGRLYRYIMAHKPKYPAHLSDQAKDLIGNMLIPDPNERCKIDFIMDHPWLNKFKVELSKTVQDLEKEAHIKKQLLLRGIESRTDLNVIGTEDDDEEDCCDSSDNEACSSVSSVSSSYSYPPSYGNTKDIRNDDIISERDQDIEEETDQNSEAAIVNEPILHLENKNNSSLPATPIPSLDTNERQTADSINSSSPYSHAIHHSKKELQEDKSSTNMPHEDKEAEIAAKDKAQHQENNKKSKLSAPIPIVTETISSSEETKSKRHTIDAAVANIFTQKQPKQLQQVDQQPIKPTRPQQHLSLRAKLFSSVKRKATNKSNGSQTVGASATSRTEISTPPSINEKPGGKNRHSWQYMMHRNTTKETLPVTPPTSPIAVEHSKSERLMTWLKKNKSTSVKKPRPSATPSSSNLTHTSGPSSRATTIPEEEHIAQSTIPVARPTVSLKPMRSNSTTPAVSRTPTLQHKRKQQQLDTLSIETELRVHTGAMNRSALTSKPPMEVLLELNKILLILGIDVDNVGGYKLHCTRRAIHASSPQRRSQTKDTTMDHLATRCEATMLSQPIYGHPSMDRGDEIRFSVEVCRFENLSGLFSVDIQSLGEETEGYQFVGQKLLSLLHFGNVIRNTNFSLMLKKEKDHS